MTEYKCVEIDLWTDKVERFRNEFSSMNDVKFEYMEVTNQIGLDKRYSLEYRNFGGELKYDSEGLVEVATTIQYDYAVYDDSILQYGVG